MSGRSDGSRWFFGCAGLGCLVVVVAAAAVATCSYRVYRGTDQARDVARAFIDLVEAGDYEAAHRRIAPEWSEAITRDEFRARFEDLAGKLGPRLELRSTGVVISADFSRQEGVAVGTVVRASFEGRYEHGSAAIRVRLRKHEDGYRVADLTYESERLDERTTCASCGTVNPPESRFCSQCGGRLGDPDGVEGNRTAPKRIPPS